MANDIPPVSRRYYKLNNLKLAPMKCQDKFVFQSLCNAVSQRGEPEGSQTVFEIEKTYHLAREEIP